MRYELFPCIEQPKRLTLGDRLKASVCHDCDMWSTYIELVHNQRRSSSAHVLNLAELRVCHNSTSRVARITGQDDR